MRIGLIGCGLSEMEYEHNYTGKYSSFLVEKFLEILSQFELIEEIYSPVNPGPELLWAHTVLSEQYELSIMVTHRNQGSHLTEKQKEILDGVKEKASLMITGSYGTSQEEYRRDEMLIDKSDVMIIVEGDNSAYRDSRVKRALTYINAKDKEKIIINLKIVK